MRIIDEATLRRLYIDEAQSIRSIAAILHVAPRSVHETLIRRRIPRRQQWQHRSAALVQSADRSQLNEPLLRQLYWSENRSIREIAAIVDVSLSSVYNALVRWNIPRRKRGPREKTVQRMCRFGPLRGAAVSGEDNDLLNNCRLIAYGINDHNTSLDIEDI